MADAPVTALVRAAIFNVCALIVAAMGAFGALTPLDEMLQGWRFDRASKEPTGEVVFVDIDASSLVGIGVWPWPRQIHADILDTLMASGAADVAFDIDFSTASSPEGDAALERALQDAGGYAFLAAFEQVLASGETFLTQPIDRFRQHADPVLVNVDDDGSRLIKTAPARSSGVPAMALALSPGIATPDEIRIDYRIDLRRVPRVPVIDVLSGNFDPALFRDRQVVIGASAIELRDFFRVPRFGVIPGPLVQIAAAETVKQGGSLRTLPWAANVLLALVVFAAASITGHRLGMVRHLVLSVLVAAATEAGALMALSQWGVELSTVMIHAALVSALVAAFLDERSTQWRQTQAQRDRLAYLARHDVVTGALSRDALIENLKAHGADEVLTAVVEMERWRAVNSSLGHDIGDDIAREIVRRLAETSGTEPTRIGPDLYALALPAVRDLPPLMTALTQPIEIGGHTVVLGVRIGCSVGTPGGAPGRLLQQAEMALARAQSQGLAMAHYTTDDLLRIEERRTLDLALRSAIARDEMHLAFQPQIDLATGSWMGFEALLRWNSGTLGPISPVRFIPVAEESGFMVDLGAWVMRQACAEAMAQGWQGRLSVNVSPVQFRMSDVAAMVATVLAETGFPAERLDIEITESLFVEGNGDILATLSALRAMGVSIAMDDFGTGYSSLSYLARLPIDKIKIDQAFVRALPDPDSTAIVETVVMLAKKLGKPLVAEGVETAAQAAFLASLGCEVGQGYHWGRPAPLTESLAAMPQPLQALAG
jgi:predicted signal transduction protein with EAL and GGDEF domain